MNSIKHTRRTSHEIPITESKQTEDFLPKLLSKELHDQKQNCKTKSSSSSLSAEASFRVYYGATGNVPFLWESTPGTPKHKSNNSSIPPLTPPPSFSYSKSKSQISLAHKKFSSSSSRIFSIINLSKLNTRRGNSCVTPTSTSSTPNHYATSLNSLFSSSSSSSSSLSTPESTLRQVRQPRRRSVFSRRRPEMFARDMDDDEQEGGAPKSMRFVCFGGGSSSSRRNGSYTVKNMKKAFSSVVGHRSSRNVIYMA